MIYYYTLLYAVYVLFLVKDGDTTRNFNIHNVCICKVGTSPSHPLNFSFDPLE